MSDDCYPTGPVLAPDPMFCALQQEQFKLGVHLGLFGLAVTCGLYNLGAYIARRQPHLALNVALYGGVVAWEVDQIRRHAQGCRS